MNYLVTGGYGFIGSHIVEHLIRQDHYVRVVDNLITGKAKNLKALDSSVTSGNLDLIVGDVSLPEVAKRAVKDIDYVFHEAALPSVPLSIENPVECHRHNVVSTIAVLDAAAKEKVRRVVLASSSAVYGNTNKIPVFEDLVPAPLSPYASDKLSCEILATMYGKLYGLSTACLRYFNVYGARQDPKSTYSAVIPAFITAILHGKLPVVHGDGRQTRDFVYVKDVVTANLLAAHADLNLRGEVFNVGTGYDTSLLSLLSVIHETVNKPVDFVTEQPREGDVRNSKASMDRSYRALKFMAATPLKEGILHTVNYYLSEMDHAKP